MDTTKVYYWYNGDRGSSRVIYDVVVHKGDYSYSRRGRMSQIGYYKNLTGIEHMVYTIGEPPHD